MSAVAPLRPALRYFGSKWRLAPWIIANLPDHVHYVEPFGGSLAVLLRKPPFRIETTNDLDRAVVAFFRVLRERPEELVRAIELTPFSRAEYEDAREPGDDELEQARRLYVLSWQQRGGPCAVWRGGWRFGVLNHRNREGSRSLARWNQTDHLYAVAARLKDVQIECDDAANVIRRYDTARTVFLVDPPYVQSTRKVRWREHAYRHELSDDDHSALAEVLRGVAGMVVLCGYPSALYAELYRGWEVRSAPAITDARQTVTECLWLNPAAAARVGQLALPSGGTAEDGDGDED